MLTAVIFIPMIAAAALLLIPGGWIAVAASRPGSHEGPEAAGDTDVDARTDPSAAPDTDDAEAVGPRWQIRVTEDQVQTAATIVAGVPLLLLAVAWLRFKSTGGFEQVEAARWIPTLGVSYRVGVDGLSLPLAAMTAFIFLVAMAYPVDLRRRAVPYFALMLFLEGVSLGLFLALDLFLFFVFWDLSLLGMYFLIGAWGHADAQRSAMKFFIYTFSGSLALLLAILGLYLASDPRTFDMAELIRQQPLGAGGLYATLVFLGFFIGFAVKTPLVPFHTWLPPAHVDAPAPASAILAGVLLKMGTYGFVRILMGMMPEAFARWAEALAVLAVISILYGSLVALAQSNVKRLIAYTSINHMGYVILGLAAAGAIASGQEKAQAIALTGATVEMVAHGLITGTMFLISGSLLARGRTYEMGEYGGLAGRARYMTGLTVVAAFASLGLPGLAGFVAEFQIFAGALAVYPVLAGIGLVGIVITAALFLRMLQRLFLGGLPVRWLKFPDLGKVEVATLGALTFFVILIGVYPLWLLNVIDSFAGPFVGRP